MGRVDVGGRMFDDNVSILEVTNLWNIQEFAQ